MLQTNLLLHYYFHLEFEIVWFKRFYIYRDFWILKFSVLFIFNFLCTKRKKMFQALSLFLFLFRDAAEAVTKRIIQTHAEFKACIWIKRYMIQEERTIPLVWMCFYHYNWFHAIIIMQMSWNQLNIVSF